MIKKLIYLLIIVLSTSCNKNPIPDTSILDEIPIKELSEIIKTDTIGKDYHHESFATMYDGIRKTVDSMTDVEKAEFIEYTYRQFCDEYSCCDDSLSYKNFSNKWAMVYKKDIDKALQKIKEWENSSEYQIIIFPFGNETADDALALYLYRYKDELSNTEWYKYCRFKGFHPCFDHCAQSNYNNIRTDWDFDQIIEDYCDDFNFVKESDWVYQKVDEYYEQKYPKLYKFMNIAKRYERQNKSNY